MEFKNGRYIFTPKKKVIAFKDYKQNGRVQIRKGTIYTVSYNGRMTEETPGWYLEIKEVGECFKYLITKSHLPRWW